MTTPISSPGCLYQYGIYPVGEGCQTTFFKSANRKEFSFRAKLTFDDSRLTFAMSQCAKGVAYETPCYQGLAYSVEKHVCDYPDNVAYCDKQTESVVGFKCPAPHELPANAVARRFLPFPRFPKPGDETAYTVCVEDSPRIHYCGDNSVFDSQSLTCIYYEDKHLQPQFAAGGFGK